MQVQEVQELSLGPVPCLGCSLQAQGDSGDTPCDTLAAVSQLPNFLFPVFPEAMTKTEETEGALI